MPTGKPTKYKKCKICGDNFLPEKPSQKICKKDHISKCPICNKPIVWNSTRDVKPCSKECSKELTRRKNIEKYGVPHPMQNQDVKMKFEQSMLSKYGVAHALQNNDIKQSVIETNREKFGCDWVLGNSDIRKKAEEAMIEKYGASTTLESVELKNKVKNTLISNYGVDNPMKSEIIRSRAIATNIEKYGVENPLQNENIKEQAKRTRIKKYGKFWSDEMQLKSEKSCIEHYGVQNPSQSYEIIDKIANTMLKKYGVKSAILVPEFRQKMINTMLQKYGSEYYVTSEEFANLKFVPKSKTNLKFSDILTKNKIPHTMEFIGISNKRYDFQIMGTNILVEIDPSYTHNIIGNHFNHKGLDSNYHQKKSELAQDAGYQCIHVFDWDDMNKIINLLIINTPIYARNCEIREIDIKTCNDFLNKYHLQNTCRGQSVRLGLFYNDDLVQVMTFGDPRYNDNYEWELLRLCTKAGMCIIGGVDRLFKYFIRNYTPKSIISYCDASKFTGDVYRRLKMKYLYTTPPTIHWSNGHKQISNNLLLKLGFDKIFKSDYGKEVSNEYLMLKHGWLPVCDCGQFVFEYKK